MLEPGLRNTPPGTDGAMGTAASSAHLSAAAPESVRGDPSGLCRDGILLLRVSFCEKTDSCLQFASLFLGAIAKAYGSSQARVPIGAIAASLHHSHSNSRSLTHRERPGIEPQTSWILVGFITTELQQELPAFHLLDYLSSLASLPEGDAGRRQDPQGPILLTNSLTKGKRVEPLLKRRLKVLPTGLLFSLLFSGSHDQQ